MNQRPDDLSLLFLDRKDLVDRYYFYADDNLEIMTVLLNLHLSISSQMTNEASFRTNEVMRVLTVFSIFFLPLNFIAGLYGMNFENMPELKEPHGYFIILTIMGIVAVSLYLWMYRQGWLKKPEDI
jgi:magnesium transporter